MLTMWEFLFDASFINFASTLFSRDINPINKIDILTLFETSLPWEGVGHLFCKIWHDIVTLCEMIQLSNTCHIIYDCVTIR